MSAASTLGSFNSTVVARVVICKEKGEIIDSTLLCSQLSCPFGRLCCSLQRFSLRTGLDVRHLLSGGPLLSTFRHIVDVHAAEDCFVLYIALFYNLPKLSSKATTFCPIIGHHRSSAFLSPLLNTAMPSSRFTHYHIAWWVDIKYTPSALTPSEPLLSRGDSGAFTSCYHQVSLRGSVYLILPDADVNTRLN